MGRGAGHENAEIQKLTGFAPLTEIQVVKCIDFYLFVTSRGTLVQSSPTIVVERLHSGMFFIEEMETINTKTGGYKQSLCKFVFFR